MSNNNMRLLSSPVSVASSEQQSTINTLSQLTLNNNNNNSTTPVQTPTNYPPQNPQHGVSGPLSLAHPTPTELKETERLVTTLNAYNVFETVDETNLRQLVLNRLEKLLQTFVHDTCLRLGYSEEDSWLAGGKVYTFGSYALGAHFAGADIDVLCLVPGMVTKQDFFNDFYAKLKGLVEVEQITAIANAHVPVIKLKFSGIQIDLVFGCLTLPQIKPNFDLDDYNLLSELDDTILRSLNGPRVSRDIISLIPNLPTLQISLRFIKLWAKSRGLYSNVLGYFGGVAWALMVARVCQLYPNATPSVIIERFFHTFHQWQWPHPVILRPIEYRASKVPVWDPETSAVDQGHRMPIVTPAFPSMCATHNVTKMNQAIISAELLRGAQLLPKVLSHELGWGELLSDPKFFNVHEQFLQIVASSQEVNRQLEWAGNVESKVRSLAVAMELVENVKLIHINVMSFDSVHYCKNEEEVNLLRLGGNLELPNNFNNNSNADGMSEVLPPLYITCFYIGIVPSVHSNEVFSAPELEPLIIDFESRLLLKGSNEVVLPSTAGLKVRSIVKSELPRNVFMEFNRFSQK